MCKFIVGDEIILFTQKSNKIPYKNYSKIDNNGIEGEQQKNTKCNINSYRRAETDKKTLLKKS